MLSAARFGGRATSVRTAIFCSAASGFSRVPPRALLRGASSLGSPPPLPPPPASLPPPPPPSLPPISASPPSAAPTAFADAAAAAALAASPVPPFLRPWVALARLDRPVGTALAALPAFWGVALAAAPAGTALAAAAPAAAAAPLLADGLPSAGLLAVCTAGALLVRGAGCAINDAWDAKFDAAVARTRGRPVASGAVSRPAAVAFAAAQAAAAAGLLLFLPAPALALAAAAVPLVAV